MVAGILRGLQKSILAMGVSAACASAARTALATAMSRGVTTCRDIARSLAPDRGEVVVVDAIGIQYSTRERLAVILSPCAQPSRLHRGSSTATPPACSSLRRESADQHSWCSRVGARTPTPPVGPQPSARSGTTSGNGCECPTPRHQPSAAQPDMFDSPTGLWDMLRLRQRERHRSGNAPTRNRNCRNDDAGSGASPTGGVGVDLAIFPGDFEGKRNQSGVHILIRQRYVRVHCVGAGRSIGQPDTRRVRLFARTGGPCSSPSEGTTLFFFYL